MKLPVYLGLLHTSEGTLAASLRQVSEGHGHEPDVHFICHTLAAQCDAHQEALAPLLERYGEAKDDEPERLHIDGLSTTRTGPVGLLRDLQDLYLLASLVDITWTMIKQAAQGLRDAELLGVVTACDRETAIQIKWLQTRMKQAAPQALILAG
ncbi:hypothetical protein [Arthrobacter pityocampae]|uniref:hypothetical protein n=1 Tax=Arthrobacter pityocampae TaxID=547334 RepID=UPI003735497F